MGVSVSPRESMILLRGVYAYFLDLSSFSEPENLTHHTPTIHSYNDMRAIDS